VKKVRALYDVAPVTNPAYPASSATLARSADAIAEELAAWRRGENAWRAHYRNRAVRLTLAGL